MRLRLGEDSNNVRVRAMTALRKLSLREGQSVSDFCLVLERLAARAYPDMPAEVTSLQKAEILFNQLAHWEGSYNLSEALESSEQQHVYDKVKEAALRLERTRRTAGEMAKQHRLGKSQRRSSTADDLDGLKRNEQNTVKQIGRRKGRRVGKRGRRGF